MKRQENGDRDWTLKELAEQIDGRVKGDENKIINCVATLRNATPNSISFMSNEKHCKFLRHTMAGAIVLKEQHALDSDRNYLISDNPRAAFARIVACLHKDENGISKECHDTAVVSDTSIIADTAAIGANTVIGESVSISGDAQIGACCSIGDGVSIGAGTRIDSNVSVYRNSRIGRHCKIHSGVVIGAPGFSYELEDGQWTEVPNIGSVIIGDNVRIGAATTIDRGSIENTIIEDGVKIDNNVQIGHNVKVGENSIIAGNVGIAGSTVVGKNCMFGGQTGIVEHVEIADNVIVLSGSVVTKTILTAGTYSSNIPAQEAGKWKKVLAKLRKL